MSGLLEPSFLLSLQVSERHIPRKPQAASAPTEAPMHENAENLQHCQFLYLGVFPRRCGVESRTSCVHALLCPAQRIKKKYSPESHQFAMHLAPYQQILRYWTKQRQKIFTMGLTKLRGKNLYRVMSFVCALVRRSFSLVFHARFHINSH